MKIFAGYKTLIILSVLLVSVFLASRLINIMTLPLFTDEAIYIRWSQIARYDANWRFISLTDGKQPSFVWLTMTVMRFISDPLLAGRLVSVGAGLMTMIGLFFVGRELFKNKWIGLLSSALYVIFPMALVYDKMALYDSLVGMFMIWSFYLGLLLAKTARLDVALLLGMIMGGGALTKTNAFFSMPLLFPAILLFDWRNKAWKIHLLKWLGLVILAIAIAMGFYSILRLSPFFHIIADKNAIFAYPLNEWITHPLEYFASNVRGLFDWLLTYYTLPFLLLIISSFLLTKKDDKGNVLLLGKILGVFLVIFGAIYSFNYVPKLNIEPPVYFPFIFFPLLLLSIYISFKKGYEYWKEKTLLIIWFVVPFAYLSFFGRTIYPRFIFFMAIFLLPLAAYSIYILSIRIKNTKLLIGSLIALFLFPLISDYYILTDFARAPIPRLDLEQYINNWPAGGGIKEIMGFLSEQAAKSKIYVASQGTFGSLPTYAVEIYLGENRNIEKRGMWPVDDKIPSDLLERAKNIPVFVVFYQSDPPPSWPLRLISRYQKGIGNQYIHLYQVLKP